MKTSELIGPALDWAVAKCEAPIGGYKAWVQADLDKGILHGMCYSSDWLWGGPIIERERIDVWAWGEHWSAGDNSALNIRAHGQTPLIAAMRCFVSSRLGDDIEIPSELIKGI